jgi:spore maturation protein CgeB
MHVAILTNYNLYESKRYFSQKLEDAFKRLGIEVTTMDVATLEEQILDFKRVFDPSETTFTCSFNSMIPDDKGTFLSDLSGVPHIAFFVDPAFYYPQTFTSSNTIISCVDHFDCDFVKANQFDRVFFWGHAVEKDLAPAADQEKLYDVVLIGSCYDHETLRDYWRKQMTPNEINSIEEAVEMVLSDNKTPVHEAIKRTLLHHGYRPPSQEDFLIKIQFYGTFVDNYTRGKDRTELIKAIPNRKVHVFGGKCWRDVQPILDWEHSLQDVSNVIIHPEVDFAQSLEILKQSKICLNSMPFFKNGTHERIFTGLACGALPITTDNLWIRHNFKHHEDILIYCPEHWNEVGSWVEEYLDDPVMLEESVARGRAKVMAEHTWDVRARQLFESLNQFT